MKNICLLSTLLLATMVFSCTSPKKESMDHEKSRQRFQLMTLDPGHFHAALVQKVQLEHVDSTVYVFAPEGPEVQSHLSQIRAYNTREQNPTAWVEEVYLGADFFEQMIAKKPGNVMVVAGNNARKTEYILKAVEAGINVLADKPMIIAPEEFERLEQAFEVAERNNVLLYDIMTERYEITTILQAALSRVPEVFGALKKGTLENPAVTKESVHHFFKYVSGRPIKRPPWFFDTSQQGEGIVDVTTHLVDLIQWSCFPGQVIDHQTDIEVLDARRWATALTRAQFRRVTQEGKYPPYLLKDLVSDSVLNVFSNGEINYTLNGIHARVSVIWNYEAPKGAKDTHYSIMRGTRANLIIQQGEAENYQPTLYVEHVSNEARDAFTTSLQKAVDGLQQHYPGVALNLTGDKMVIDIPARYRIGHEAHFTQVTEKYLEYLADGKLPDWEVPNMIAKYYTTIKGYEMSR
jgi:predicted dehydrogenase